MEPFFQRTFWITVIMLWAALMLLYFILTDKRALRRKGHHEKYIAYLRKSHLVRILTIAVVLPLLILFAGWIVYRLTGMLTREAQLAYIAVVLVILVIPFKFLDERINQKRIRELALETHEKIAIDLNYKTLHMIFNPAWELLLGPATLLYGMLFLHIEQWIVYLFLLFPWFMYLNIRGTRYQTRPYLIDNYKYMFTFNMFSFLFFLFYFSSFYLLRVTEFLDSFGSGMTPDANLHMVPSVLLLIAGFALIACQVGRSAIYMGNYRPFHRAMTGGGQESKHQPVRKLAYFIAGMVFIFVLSGVATTSGIMGMGRTQVGVVSEKIIIDGHRTQGDTLLVVNGSHPGSAEELLSRISHSQLELFCTIRLSRSNQVRSYAICCPSTFDSLPVGRIVKFEVGPGPSVSRLIEY